TVKVTGLEAAEMLRLPFQTLDHLGGADPPGERGSENRARAQAHVGIEFFDLFIEKEIVQRLQATQFEGTSRYRAAGENKCDLRVLLAYREIALLNDGNSHRLHLSINCLIYLELDAVCQELFAPPLRPVTISRE